MTREEAIEMLKALNMMLRSPDGEPISDACDALDMAIEALNREQKKYDAICSELVALKNNLNEPIEVAIAYEKSIAIVNKYARKSEEE